MKKTKENIILVLLLVIFIMLFKYSVLIKSSVLSSINLWVTSLIPSMLPMFIIIDLFINYGLVEFLYRIFKNNALVLVLFSITAGTPSNAKYISEFYKNGYISRDTGNLLLLCSYSPNPLFVITFSPSIKVAVLILGYIYLSNLVIFLVMKRRFKNKISVLPRRDENSFIDTLVFSIYRSLKVLVLILGVVVVYGILNTFLEVLNIDSPLILSVLELTNALVAITNNNYGLLYMMFACSFGGLSIHTQIKSILEDTDLSYKYFLIGRLIASIPILVLILFN